MTRWWAGLTWPRRAAVVAMLFPALALVVLGGQLASLPAAAACATVGAGHVLAHVIRSLVNRGR